MTPETDEQVRERMRRLQLPEAPDALRARVVGVAATRPPTETVTIARSGRLLVPIAAMLLIGGAAILGSGGGPRPPSGQPTDAFPAGPAVAKLQVLAANYETPSHPGGLTFRVELSGPGGTWSGQLAHAELGALMSVSPPLPENLSAGSYSLRTEIHVFGDAIYPGETGPRDLGTTATCTSDFVVTPETRVVSITLGYWADRRCAAGTITTHDPRTLVTFLDMPSFAGSCGEDVGGCDYRLGLSGPGGTWGSVYHTVKPPGQLVTNLLTDLPLMLSPGTYRLDASSHRMSREPEPGVGHQSEIEVAGTCFVEFTVGGDMNQVLVSIDFQGETCTASAETDLIPTAPAPSAVGPVPTAFALGFSPPYGNEPTDSEKTPISAVTLAPDGRRLTVDFVGSGGYFPGTPCATYSEPWVGIDGDTLLVALVLIHVPSPSGCPIVPTIGYPMRYELELPAVYNGSTVRDLAGQTFEVRG